MPSRQFTMAWVKSSVAGAAMLAFYFVTLSVLGGGWGFAWRQFGLYWWLILPITITFAAQVYLAGNMKMVAGSGGVSGVAMAACCAHHVAEFLPFLSLFTAASFLIRYQVQFMFLALALNIGGLIYLLLRSKRANYHTTEYGS